jgi:2',3'-cyclic-nucleotide 2'-phosphodiesterase (5'-nucleotidase family)
MRRLLSLSLILLAAAAWAGEQWKLTILHTNDLHGMLLPHDYQVPGAGAPVEVGGLARRATALAQLRKATTNPLVVLDGGDFFTRGPWQINFYGTPEIDTMNRMGYDLLCVGNNEFKGKPGTDSQEVLLGLLRRSRFPWLAANLTVGETGVPVPGIHPFVVRDFQGVRVGFLGLTAPRSKDYAQTKGWTIGDPIDAAKRWVPLARRECDLLIAVTHIGVDLDKQLAAAVPGIDAIVGADSHTVLPTPLRVKSPTGSEVPIVQAGELGVYLGKFDLVFEKTDAWRLTAAEGKLILIDQSFAEDAGVKALLERYLKPPVPVTWWGHPAWAG